jgi:RimJ/RimL family protein N-acetyltransferase
MPTGRQCWTEGEIPMTEASSFIRESYPREIGVGAKRTATLRLMEKSDRDRVVDFARSLPPDDLLFLRKDITASQVVDEWLRDIEAGHTITVLAEADGELVGYGSLLRDESLWGRHMGEIRVLVKSDYRGVGLGRRLAFDVFAIAKVLGLEKITARMTPEQTRTRAILERLGFTVDAVLRGFVRDREGKVHDLVVMSSDVAGLTDAEQLTAWQQS